LTTNAKSPQGGSHQNGQNPIAHEPIAIKIANGSTRDVPASDIENAVPAPERRTQTGSESAEGSESDALINRQWIHESGYGGKGGEPRISSDQREASEHAVHLDNWPEFSPDMLPSETGLSSATKPPTNEPRINKPKR